MLINFLVLKTERNLLFCEMLNLYCINLLVKKILI